MDDDWFDDDYPSQVPDLTVWPTEAEPEPVFFLADGTPLYRARQPFGFARGTQPARKPKKAKAKGQRSRRTG